MNDDDTSQPEKCPRCGDPLTDDAPRGLCPQCLPAGGLESTVEFADEGGDSKSDAAAAQTARLRPGDAFGDYRIGHSLGSGGMGTVFAAEHVPSGRRVALKVLGHRLQSPEHRRRFLREGRLAASINHPHTVYVYGTELIDDAPVISMELAPGGTLQHRVERDGPLEIGEAVDAALEIVAGLEAAAAAGVLHRDVKPSNCFVDADRTIKVGDFGLSISTTLRHETNLTESGLFLGTPAFSSPEQLRGDELDVRSDIYAVGVTLFYLLTGQTPFQARQMVHLLATVLERPAPSPSTLRSDLPPGLARIVLRCLAKRKEDRFKDYDELRRALLPYTSQAPIPATVGFRVLAYVVDSAVLTLLAALIPLLWFRGVASWYLQFSAMSEPGPNAPELVPFAATGMILQLAYFTLCEGLWGATAGKSICRLRVVGPDREAARRGKALIRASIFLGAGWIPWWIYYAWDDQAAIAASQLRDGPAFALVALATVGMFLIVFGTMRKRNGFAGLHELASGTRTIRLPARRQRPTLASDPEPLPETQDARQLGPYHVLGRLDGDDAGEWLLGYDSRLLRKVWIRVRPADAAPVAAPSRELSRIGRLRWLNAGAVEGECRWEAYEGPEGQPLLRLLDEPQPWDAVRFWLSDLARELNASLKDGNAPASLELDRVWITADGRAKLLDFPAPGASGMPYRPTHPAPTTLDTRTAHALLKRVAVAALEGRVVSADEAGQRDVSARIPLSARVFLNQLGGTSDLDTTIRELESFTRKPASVSLGKRVAVLVACWLPPLLMVTMSVSAMYAEWSFALAHPGIGELSGLVSFHRSLADMEADSLRNGVPVRSLREALEIEAAGRFRSLIRDDRLWADPLSHEFVGDEGRRWLRRVARERGEPPPESIAEAEQVLLAVAPEIESMEWTPEFYASILSTREVMVMLLALFVGMVVVPGLVTTLLLGNSLLLRLMEIAVVTRDGERASRPRVLWRNAALWTIVVAALVVIGYFAVVAGHPRPSHGLLIFVIVAMFVSPRGLHDRLAGTWLVPR